MTVMSRTKYFSLIEERIQTQIKIIELKQSLINAMFKALVDGGIDSIVI